MAASPEFPVNISMEYCILREYNVNREVPAIFQNMQKCIANVRRDLKKETGLRNHKYFLTRFHN